MPFYFRHRNGIRFFPDKGPSQEITRHVCDQAATEEALSRFYGSESARRKRSRLAATLWLMAAASACVFLLWAAAIVLTWIVAWWRIF